MPKKIISILLILVLALNWCGYNLVYNYKQYKANQTQQHNIATNNYNEAELLTIAIPLNMPYQSNRCSYEACKGEITYNGRVYNYVKRTIQNGELILKCLPNTLKQNLLLAKNKQARADYDDANQPQNNIPSKIGKKNTNDYLQKYSNYTTALLARISTPHFAFVTNYYQSAYRTTPHLPPATSVV